MTDLAEIIQDDEPTIRGGEVMARYIVGYTTKLGKLLAMPIQAATREDALGCWEGIPWGPDLDARALWVVGLGDDGIGQFIEEVKRTTAYTVVGEMGVTPDGC